VPPVEASWRARFVSTPTWAGTSRSLGRTSGGAVFWTEGEMHETGTDSGMMAIVVETAALLDDEHLGPVR